MGPGPQAVVRSDWLTFEDGAPQFHHSPAARPLVVCQAHLLCSITCSLATYTEMMRDDTAFWAASFIVAL